MGVCSPRKFLEIRCSDVAFEAILGQKQSHSSCMVHGVLRPILASMFAFAKPADFKFSREGTKVGRTAGGVASLEGQLLST